MPVNSLHLLGHGVSGATCHLCLGIVRQWPAGDHIITTTMRLDEAINGGWDDYPAGDYTDGFKINAKP